MNRKMIIFVKKFDQFHYLLQFSFSRNENCDYKIQNRLERERVCKLALITLRCSSKTEMKKYEVSMEKRNEK